MNYESLIFDIDGTLWDARALSAEGWNQHMAKEGYSQYHATAELISGLLGKTTREIADIVFQGIADEGLRYDLMIRCMQAENDYLASQECDIGYPGVRETIAKLAEKHRIFLVSNCDVGYPEICMDKLGLTPYIRDHLCYGDTLTSKGQTIRTLMARNRIESCAYIGDTQGDYEATLEAGIPFVWAAYGFGQPEGYTYKIDSFRELLNL